MKKKYIIINLFIIIFMISSSVNCFALSKNNTYPYDYDKHNYVNLDEKEYMCSKCNNSNKEQQSIKIVNKRTIQNDKKSTLTVKARDSNYIKLFVTFMVISLFSSVPFLVIIKMNRSDKN